MQQSILHPPQPSTHDNRIDWYGAKGCSVSLALVQLAKEREHPILLVTPDIHTVQTSLRELRFFANGADLDIIDFPDWETLPFDHFSPHQDIVSRRLRTLYYLPHMKRGIVVVAINTLMQRLLPSDYLGAHSLILKCGDRLDFDGFRQQLIAAGYRHVEQVFEHGEFALRGSIIDIFPMGHTEPFRIELFDDVVDTIRLFDIETQRSTEKIDSIDLLPAHEYPLSEDGITHFRSSWRARFPGNPAESNLYQAISHGEAAAGVEYYLPLFFDALTLLSDYLPAESDIALLENTYDQALLFWKEIKNRHEQLRYDTTRPLCEPDEVYAPPEFLFSKLKNHTQILPREDKGTNDSNICFSTSSPPALTIESYNKAPLENLQQSLAHHDGRVLFCAESAGRREILLDLFRDADIKPQPVDTWHDFLNADEQHCITVAALDRGMLLTDPNIMLVSETQLFGEQVMQRRLRKTHKQDPQSMIKNLMELSVGSPIVHIEHGIGRYCGLERITAGEHEGEYLTLEYAEGDKVYVPVSSLHLISRYTGADVDHVSLQRLGSSSWKKIRERAAKRVRDVAAELLDVYSQREASKGFAFPEPDKDFHLFCQGFPFEATPDQLHAIDDVVKDMSRARCMDRLICGDVGFGKTEVAMRAAFLAAQGGKQVAILVPTTLLAEQHLQNFQDRFADWPVRIAGLSRLRSAKEQQATLKGLEKGEIDIVIGTHKLLQEDVKLKDLGLLIVDEEHRFGVRQKERIKALRAHVDILTLTATPIPRTLNMALSGTRDLSIISTPPARRLAVKTFVHEYDTQLIREAILREALRGGQIFYLHNEVATINATAEKLQKILPDARIGIAHGQMRELELERVMSDFYHQRFNVLVCTTIIESGIDIPTANTIIIERADRFGLAQLHQIRGRVGRSHHQAYAYLLVPDYKSITRDAEKRLEAISQLEELGAGFNLATHDLEIRGAGELLGEEQSGHIAAIGFNLYMELLDDAVKALQDGREPDNDLKRKQGAEIDLHLSALIPETYVHDVQQRLSLYKRLANCETDDAIAEFKAELVDRFGKLPEQTQKLIHVTQIKLQAQPLGIEKIDVGKKFGYLHFADHAQVEPQRIVHLMQTQADRYQMQGANKLRFTLTSESDQARMQCVRELLQKLT